MNIRVCVCAFAISLIPAIVAAPTDGADEKLYYRIIESADRQVTKN